MKIREAIAADLDAITAIYRDAVLNETGTFEITPPELTEMAKRMAAIQDAGFPWLVACDDNAVLGYAYAGPFKPRAAYAGTVEDSVYIARDGRGRGIGKALIQAIIERCQKMGKREMIAIIGGGNDNAGSIALHKACGFREAGRLSGVGQKFGRTLDSVYMQRNLHD